MMQLCRATSQTQYNASIPLKVGTFLANKSLELKVYATLSDEGLRDETRRKTWFHGNKIVA